MERVLLPTLLSVIQGGLKSRRWVVWFVDVDLHVVAGFSRRHDAGSRDFQSDVDCWRFHETIANELTLTATGCSMGVSMWHHLETKLARASVDDRQQDVRRPDLDSDLDFEEQEELDRPTVEERVA